MCGPVCRTGDCVYYPSLGCYPIIAGCSRFIEACMPVACVGDRICCPGGAVLTTGSCLNLESCRPVCRTGDISCGGEAGTGCIISGSPLYLIGS